MLRIRKGQKEDMAAVLDLIKELAEYEKAPEEVEMTENRLIKDGFGDKPLFETLVAEKNEKIIGMALYYKKYSTWKGMSIYLEDIIVTRDFRRKGIGATLFEAVINKSYELGAQRMEWQVLDWNEPAIEFYKKYNAELDEEWVNGQFKWGQIKELCK
ncbi:MAG: N-acetyltransferase family protein [Flavobacteriales bacterium]